MPAMCADDDDICTAITRILIDPIGHVSHGREVVDQGLMMLQSRSLGRCAAFLKNGLSTGNELWPKVPKVAIAEVILQEAVIDDVQNLEFRVTCLGEAERFIQGAARAWAIVDGDKNVLMHD